jgi:hypothetical protein
MKAAEQLKYMMNKRNTVAAVFELMRWLYFFVFAL